METTLNLNVTGKYMGQEYTGKIGQFTASNGGEFVAFTIELDAPIKVFALGEIKNFIVKYENGNLNSTRQTIINLV